MVHDLRNVLSVVQAAADSLAAAAAARERGGDPDAALNGPAPSLRMLDQDIDTIRAAVRRGAALTRRIIGPHSAAAGRVSAISVDAAVADIACLLARLMPSGIRLECSGSAGHAALAVDRLDFERMMMNLVVNARDAMRAGVIVLCTGTATLEVAEPALSASVPPGRYVIIDVRDQGCGIPPEALAHIGAPYFTTKTNQGGTGLGLATVRHLAAAAQGFVRISSVPAQGTEVRLYFPWVEPDGDTDESRRASTLQCVADTVLPLGRGTVLLVDDDEALRHLAARALQRAGWVVLEAATAAEAFAAVRAQPDGALVAMVSDLALPGTDGFALIATLRAQYAPARLPAVLMSGYLTDAAVLADGLYLEKPFSMNDLVAAVAAVSTAIGAG